MTEEKRFYEPDVIRKLIKLMEYDYPSLSQKSLQFLDFVPHVIDHLENYVVPQYGDLPDEMIDGFDIPDMRSQAKRYAGRFGNNARGIVEDHRDCVKLAHYSCYMKEKLEERDGGNPLTYKENSDGD